MAETLELPAELRGLVAFLEQDNRPTALLNGQDELLYQNGKFEYLGLEPDHIDRILERLRSEGDATAVDGRLWKRISVLDKWSTLVCSGTLYTPPGDIADLSKLDLGEETVAVSDGNEAAGLKVHPGSLSRGDCLDWTRYDVPDLSPWIKYARDYDWASTGLGPMSEWPMHVRRYIVYMMSNPNPRLMVWNAGNTFLYNEACIPLWGSKHPECFGKPVQVPFGEIWEGVKPLIEAGLDGEVRRLERLPVMLQRTEVANQPEDTYFDFSLMPIIGPDGKTVGLIDEVAEVTKAVRSDRRRRSALNVMECLASVSTLKQLWASYLAALESCHEDIAFALIYSVVDDVPEGSPAESVEKRCNLEGSVGLEGAAEHLQNASGLAGPALEVHQTGKPVMLNISDGSLPEALAVSVAGRAFGDKVCSARVAAIVSGTTGAVLGILVIGLSPRSPFDDEYELYTQLLADALSRAASLVTLPEEQRRARKVIDDFNTLSAQLRSTALQVERAEAKFQRMAESAPTGMYMFDADGRTIRTNEAYLELLGDTEGQHAQRTPEQQTWADIMHPDDLEKFIRAWETIKETKSPVTVEYRLKKPWKSVDKATGQSLTGERWLLANAFPDVGPDGKVAAVLGWLTDISHRKFSENLLAQRLEDALENKRQTENFIDMTSHEMRNPLSAILQSADSIVSTLTTEVPVSAAGLEISNPIAHELVDAANTIILCAQHQKRIVDDILTLSKLDASLLVISPDQIEPPVLIEKALKMFEAEIARAEIEASLCVEQSYYDLSVDWITVDSSRLLQVVINLLTNAIKFTQYSDRRRITVCLGASRERPSGAHHNVTFIPPRHVPSEETTKAGWGDGEELYLQIAVSDSGRGLSGDEMKLLFQRFQQASPRTYKQYGGSGLGLFISRELCELQGGQIGVRSGEGHTTFAFFVKAKRWVPEDPRSAPSVMSTYPRCAGASASPIVYERRGSKQLCANGVNGADAHLDGSAEQTPVAGNESNFVNTMTGVQRRTPTTYPGAKDLHVLLVEDNIINQQVMSRLLRRAGCTVHVANHGLECLEFLEQTTFRSQATPLTLILLDLEMPTMDGLTCIKHIREQQLSKKIQNHIPVIAVTANARSEQISAALSAGMDQVVTKPFRIPELMPQMFRLVAEIAQRQAG